MVSLHPHLLVIQVGTMGVKKEIVPRAPPDGTLRYANNFVLIDHPDKSLGVDMLEAAIEFKRNFLKLLISK